MATFTENYNLIKPGLEDYYDVANFNENMDAIDAALTETAGIDEKVGTPTEVGTTLFSLLENCQREDIFAGIKSMQRVICTVPSGTTSNSCTLKHPVNATNCIVLMERLLDQSEIISEIDYTLTNTAVKLTHASYSNNITRKFGFWIIEFN